VVDSFSLQAQQKQVSLTKDVVEVLGPCSFDELHVRRALANLLENAIRHAPEGGNVRVSAQPDRGGIDPGAAGSSSAEAGGAAGSGGTGPSRSRRDDAASPDTRGTVIEVWNDGPSISPEDLPHVFERFYRSDKSRGRATGKAGLGLAIAKAIVEAHGGTVVVESSPHRGTAFIVRLPAAR